MKAKWLLLIFCLVPPSVEADLLESIAERMRQVESIGGGFRQEKHVQVLPLPLVSTGVFQFHRNEGMVWELQSPVQQTLSVTAEDTTAKGESADSLGDSVNSVLFLMLGGHVEGLKDYFAISAGGAISDWNLLLTPRSRAMAQFIEEIRIQGDRHLRTITVTETNTDTTVITLSVDNPVR